MRVFFQRVISVCVRKGGQRALSRVSRRSLCLWGAAIALGACPVAGVAGDSESLSEKVAKVREWQTEAEIWARKLKAHGKLPASALSGGRDRYEQARAAFDAWRLALKTDLAAGSAKATAHQAQRLQQAADKAAAFVHYSEGVLSRGGAGGGAASLGLSIKLDLDTLVLGLIKEWLGQQQKTRDEINQILDQLAWRSFESV